MKRRPWVSASYGPFVGAEARTFLFGFLAMLIVGLSSCSGGADRTEGVGPGSSPTTAAMESEVSSPRGEGGAKLKGPEVKSEQAPVASAESGESSDASVDPAAQGSRLQDPRKPTETRAVGNKNPVPENPEKDRPEKGRVVESELIPDRPTETKGRSPLVIQPFGEGELPVGFHDQVQLVVSSLETPIGVTWTIDSVTVDGITVEDSGVRVTQSGLLTVVLKQPGATVVTVKVQTDDGRVAVLAGHWKGYNI